MKNLRRSIQLGLVAALAMLAVGMQAQTPQYVAKQPANSQTVIQPAGTTFSVNSLNWMHLFSDTAAQGPTPSYSGGRQYFGYGAGSSDTVGPLANPTAPAGTPSTSGGTLAAQTYNIKMAVTDGAGNITASSPEISVTTTGTTGSIAFTATPVSGAAAYSFYVGTSSGQENALYQTTNSTPSYTLTSYTAGSAVPPTTNTTTGAGFWNTGFGFAALAACSTANCNKNTAFGFEALQNDVQGRANTAVGMDAETSMTSGLQNVAVGADAEYDDQTGGANVAVGVHALQTQNGPTGNTAIGFDSGQYNVSGIDLTALGFNSCNNSNGNDNTCIGFNSGYTEISAISTTFVGSGAGFNNTASSGTAVGADSQYFNSSGYNNTSVGANSLFHNVTGTNQTALGYEALANTGYAGNSQSNTAVGSVALQNDTTGSDNVALGYNAGYSNTTGSYNIFLGNGGGYSNTTGSHQFFAGNVTSTGDFIADVYFGSGAQDPSPASYTIHGTANMAPTANGAGGSVTIAGGASTGNADGGSVDITVTPGGASGTTTNTPVTAIHVSPSGTQFGLPIVNGIGLQKISGATCTTGATAGSYCTTNVTLPVTEPDSNYFISCGLMNTSYLPYYLSAYNLTTTTFQFYIANLTANASSATYACLVWR